LLYDWAKRAKLQDQDAADLIQEVFSSLLEKLQNFRYDRDGSFRGWLRTVLLNKWRENQRRRVPQPVSGQDTLLVDLPDPAEADLIDEQEYRAHLVRGALDLIRSDLQPTTWRVWQEYVVAGRPAAEVARELNMSTHSVYLAKARVLQRLRQELNGLLDH
jgi:RNA polymerase sigma-70 factor (ECF subfamily)